MSVVRSRLAEVQRGDERERERTWEWALSALQTRPNSCPLQLQPHWTAALETE